MGRMGMISNGNYYFNQNRFLCSFNYHFYNYADIR